jgi:hypothetical protein
MSWEALGAVVAIVAMWQIGILSLALSALAQIIGG